MKTKFDYVYFLQASYDESDIKWYCHSTISKNMIGTVNYSKDWNIHYFKPYANTVYTYTYLLDIYNFVDSLDV